MRVARWSFDLEKAIRNGEGNAAQARAKALRCKVNIEIEDGRVRCSKDSAEKHEHGWSINDFM